MNDFASVDIDVIEDVAKEDLPETVRLVRAAGIHADLMDTASPKAYRGDLYEKAGRSRKEADNYLVEALVRTSRNLAYCADALVVIAEQYRNGEDDGAGRVTSAGD